MLSNYVKTKTKTNFGVSLDCGGNGAEKKKGGRNGCENKFKDSKITCMFLGQTFWKEKDFFFLNRTNSNFHSFSNFQ